MSHQEQFDLVIRGGTIVDGSGGDPFTGDISLRGGRIAAIGKVDGKGTDEIDATGHIVTPGFVDVHTHYDGQANWSDRLSPSSCHGVTTAVLGNCGVGFAPCRPADRDMLIKAMEGVEDIPEIVMAEGLTWDWETFPQFLDALDRRPHDIDVAAYLPHSALRIYVMGERGANREPATAEDIRRMAAAARDAMRAGAIGFSTSRIHNHRRSDGELIPSIGVPTDEIVSIAAETAAGGGIFQIVPELTESKDSASARAGFDLLCDISRRAQVHVSFSVAQMQAVPHLLPEILQWLSDANKEPGVSISAQMYPRPIGLIMGFDITANPFSTCSSYRALGHLPWAERITALRDPEVRARIIAEEPDRSQMLAHVSRLYERAFAMDEVPNYEPDLDDSIASIARRRGISPEEAAYDLLLEKDGHGKLWVAISNYASGSLDFLRDDLQRPDVVLGLGDGGAHYGLVCDASWPTFALAHWGRDRTRGRIALPKLVEMLTAIPAKLMGFGDRGRLAVGMKADINVIDHQALKLETPTLSFDLPGGNRRVVQGAQGYRATIVSGTPVLLDDQPTGRLPGRLVRGRQPAPVMQGTA